MISFVLHLIMACRIAFREQSIVRCQPGLVLLFCGVLVGLLRKFVLVGLLRKFDKQRVFSTCAGVTNFNNNNKNNNNRKNVCKTDF